jgi:hypothetical protein
MKTERRRWFRLRYVLAVTMPLLLIIGVLGADVYAERLRLERTINPALLNQTETSRADLMRAGLNDAFKRLAITLTTPDVRADSPLEDWFITVDPASVAQLDSNLPESGDEYVRGYVQVEEGKTMKVKVRYRGDNAWHWFYPQKSWRINTPDDNLIDRTEKINLLNPKSKSMLENYLATQLGESLGLITPRHRFVRLFVNNAYQGVYEWIDQVDETMLRLKNKLPGNLYAGEGGPTMWDGNGTGWTKESVYNIRPEEDFRDLAALLAALRVEDWTFPQKFSEVADVQQFLRFEALLAITASGHIDYAHNHKIYVDPSAGKAQPVPWDLFGHGSQPQSATKSLGVVHNPISEKLRAVPRWEDESNRILWDLLNGKGSAKAQLAMVGDVLADIRPDVYADRMKDYPDFLMSGVPSRPFSNQDFEESIGQLRDWISLRDTVLRDQLNQARLYVQFSGPGAQQGSDLYHLNFVADGWSGSRLNEARLKFGNAPLVPGTVEVWEDRNQNGTVDVSDRKVKVLDVAPGTATIPLELDQTFYPGRTMAVPYALGGEYAPTPLQYPHLLVAKGGLPKLTLISADAVNSVTGKAASTALGAAPATKTLVSIHPWAEPAQSANSKVALGPGVINVMQDLVYPVGTTVVIQPGTTLRFAPGKSLFSFGQLLAEGTPDKPIIFTALDRSTPWGVLALQGPGAKGSRVAHAIVERGSEADYGLVHYSGNFSVYNAGIDVTAMILRDNFGEDGFNAKQSDARISWSRFERIKSDAIDFDMGNGEITNCYFADTGNDAMDFSTTRPLVRDILVLRPGDKGISVGEGSAPRVFNMVVADGNIGIQVKDGSDPLITNVVLVNNKRGIDLYQKNLRYGDGGHARIANSIVAGNSEADYSLDKRSEIKIFNGTPGSSILERDENLKTVNMVSVPVNIDALRQAGWTIPAKSDMAGLLGSGSAAYIREAMPDMPVGAAPVGLFRPLQVPVP